MTLFHAVLTPLRATTGAFPCLHVCQSTSQPYRLRRFWPPNKRLRGKPHTGKILRSRHLRHCRLFLRRLFPYSMPTCIRLLRMRLSHCQCLLLPQPYAAAHGWICAGRVRAACGLPCHGTGMPWPTARKHNKDNAR